ncbi:MAG: amidohydrolase family protein [Paracoccaceae bacterium]|nr:MAG: amidohydrolase family protein [Paracoccaceae bacterium]
MPDHAARVTHLKGADWVVAWDAAARRHIYLRNADLVFRGDRIVHVGAGWQGQADQVVDCARRMLMPGLVNIHAHPSSTLEAKSLIEEVATIELGSSLLYDIYKSINIGAAYKRASLSASLAELLKGGSTTVVDISYVPAAGTYPAVEGWAETMADSGIRAYVGAQAASAVHYTPDGHTPAMRWAPDGGERALREAVDIADEAVRHGSGRVGAVLAAAQADSVTPELLRDLKAEARARGWSTSIHTSQSPIEFREMVHRTGRTSIGWLADQGFLDDRTILAHCLFMDCHPDNNWPPGLRRDRAILAATGATVAHCPWIQAKNGRIMHSFAGYLRDGLRVGIGTDCAPMSMLEELRWVTVMSRVAEGWRLSTTTADVLHAATIAGADVLGRDDLGRLAPGAKADILSIDLDHPQMLPTQDPLRSLIFYAQERPLRDVWVDGRQVVAAGETVFVDHAAALAELCPGFDAMLADVARHDHAGRDRAALFPLSLPVMP